MGCLLLQALLMILDSPLNKAGKVKGIYIHTARNVLIQVNSSSTAAAAATTAARVDTVGADCLTNPSISFWAQQILNYAGGLRPAAALAVLQGRPSCCNITQQEVSLKPAG